MTYQTEPTNQTVVVNFKGRLRIVLVAMNNNSSRREIVGIEISISLLNSQENCGYMV